MALIKIYSLSKNRDQLFGGVAESIKLISAAALNFPELPTTPGSIETVYIEGIDLVGIDFMLEVVAVERPNQQDIADSIIKGLNEVYPDLLFSVYFNTISEIGMANTPRKIQENTFLSMDDAVARSRK